jgi:hypothetical protein
MKDSLFWDITLSNPMKVNHISNEHMGSIFRVEEYAKQYEPT